VPLERASVGDPINTSLIRVETLSMSRTIFLQVEIIVMAGGAGILLKTQDRLFQSNAGEATY